MVLATVPKSSKNFCNVKTSHTRPALLRSNGFVECMVGVAKKLMDKAGTERKPWISGLFDYRVTP